MNTEYINDFLILAEELNYQTAADRLSVSQSTLSRHIMALESDLGQTLFVRTAHGVFLSKKGEIFLPYAKNMQSIYDIASNKVNPINKSIAGSLNIGVTSTVLNQYGDIYMEWFIQFMIKYPRVRLNIYEDSIDRLAERLGTGQYNFVFTQRSVLFDRKDFISLECARDPLVAVLPENHDYSSAESISFAQLSEYCLIVQPETDPIYTIVKTHLDKLNNPKTKYFNGHVRGPIVSKLISDGYGIAVQTESQANTEHAKHVRYIKIKPDEYVYFDAVSNNTDLNNAGYRFWKFIANSIKKKD